MLRDQFGAQWTHGDMPSMGWCYALQDMTADQLRNGIDNLVHREDSHWPPNAQEFADLCRNSFTWERQCHKAFTPVNKLEDLSAKEANQDVGSSTLSSLKAMFA